MKSLKRTLVALGAGIALLLTAGVSVANADTPASPDIHMHY